MANLELELHSLRVHYAANRLNEEGVPFDRSFNQFDHIISLVEAAAGQREAVKALRDVEASLIDWDVLRGDEPGTAEAHESNRIAAWVGLRADQMEGDE